MDKRETFGAMNKTGGFGQWLRQRRKALGLTQKALAQQAGCAEITLRKIESGDLQPSAPLVASLARALGVPNGDLPGLVSLARGTAEDFTTARLLRPQRPNNLPAQLTPLIGRQHDITALRRRLIGDGARLVTLVGPPGVGKTRLALAVAEDVLEQFTDGVFFVRLGPTSDPALVAAAIAQALGLELGGPNPPELQLRAYLKEKHLLLVLDNFEQIVAAAPLVDDLLRRCPWLHVLVTSRQPLRVRGERQVIVRPLALPAAAPRESPVTAEDMLRYPAVALFADRAEAVQPDFAVVDDNAAAVAELCRRLDGLPLAIELVAARVKLLPPNELLPRLHGPWLLSTDGLRDVSARQKTLRGAIGWSYDLLTPVEQTLFTRLAVFVGGCTLEAAELLCGDALSPPLPLPLSPAQVLDGIASLLDKNLLHRQAGLHGETRYAMLETVREYGLERVASSDLEATLRKQHAKCFVRLAEMAEHSGPDFGFWQVRFFVDDEIHNIRTALVWAMKYDTDVALLLTAAILRWQPTCGPYAEARRLIDEVLALPAPSAHTISRTKALREATIFMWFSNECDKATAYGEESLVLSRELEYDKGEAYALLWLGEVARTCQLDQSIGAQLLEQALSLFRRLGDPEGIAITLIFLAEIACQKGCFSHARELSEESFAIANQSGFRFSWPLHVLGTIARAEGNLDQARMHYNQSLTIERQRGSLGTDMSTLLNLAEIAVRQQDFPTAHALLDEGMTRSRGTTTSDDIYLCGCHLYLGIMAQFQGDYAGAVAWYKVSLPGMRYSRANWSDYGLGLAALAEALERHELTAKLLSSTEAADVPDYRMMPVNRSDYDRLIEDAHAHLSVERFDGAWAEGRERPFVQVIEEAVAILEEVLDVKMQAVSV